MDFGLYAAMLRYMVWRLIDTAMDGETIGSVQINFLYHKGRAAIEQVSLFRGIDHSMATVSRPVCQGGQ